MSKVILTVKQYKELLNRVDKIYLKLEGESRKKEDGFVDNQEFVNIMSISKRTAQSWRDEGKISFSQIGSKIYYKMSDVQKLLDANYKKAFNPKRRKSQSKTYKNDYSKI